MVHLSSFRKVKAFGRTNFISSTGCPSEHPEQRGGGDYNFIQPSTGGPGIVAGSLISGGHGNCVYDNLAAIGGGSANLIDVGGERSVISGGNNNTIIAQGAVIGGGTNNTVSGNCSVIAGGENNVVSGAYSAILGGNGNNDGGLGFVGIFGNGLAAVSADTFHVSCLNAVNTPVLFGQPPGTLTYILATPGMVAAGFPVGSKIAMIA